MLSDMEHMNEAHEKQYQATPFCYDSRKGSISKWTGVGAFLMPVIEYVN